MVFVFLTLVAVIASLWAYSHFKVHAKLDAILHAKQATAPAPVTVNVNPAPVVVTAAGSGSVIPPGNVNPPPPVAEPPQDSGPHTPPGVINPPPPQSASQGPVPAVSFYAKQGAEIYPGMVLSDGTNGLVSFPAVAKAAGFQFLAGPTFGVVDPKSQAAATIARNQSNAASADVMHTLEGLVHTLVAQNINPAYPPFIDSGKTLDVNVVMVSPRYDTLAKVSDYITNVWQAPTFNPNQFGGGAVIGH